MSSPAGEPSVQTAPATPERWQDLVTVMGTRGDASRCWCQFFRRRRQEWQSATRSDNQAALREQVCESSMPPGVIAYLGDEPVGWCAVGPKRDYPRLLKPGTDADLAGVWSLTCFVVRVGHRRRGVASGLLTGAVDFARGQGAAVVEAYPVDASKRRSVSSAELFQGPLSLFRAAGFAVVSRPSPARAVVQLVL